jgi:hypothetical protein
MTTPSSVPNMPIGQRVTKTMNELCLNAICANTRLENAKLKAEVRVLRTCLNAIGLLVDQHEPRIITSKANHTDMIGFINNVRSALARARR